MFDRVAVIGAGVAGVAAAWAAAQRGAQIRLFDGGPGASCLGCGAVDDRPWEKVARSVAVLEGVATAGHLPESVRIFADDLDLWRLPLEGEPLPRLATLAGRVRLARGHDRSVLDLARLRAGARVIVPRLDRPEWDADILASALSGDAYAQSRRLRFEAIDAKLLKHVGEERIASADLAARHQAPDRCAWLIARLRELVARAGRADALLLGPWLGSSQPLAAAVSEELGLPVGEVLGDVGAAAGLRYEAARDALMEHIGIEIEPAVITAIERIGSEARLVPDEGEPLLVDAVVLALGGVVGGGVVYDPPEQRAGADMPAAGGRPFRISLELEVPMQGAGRPLDVVSSVHGPALDDVAWPRDADPGLLESVGVACDGFEVSRRRGRHLPLRLFAAGDVVADMPRTILQAVFSGIRAGALAAGEPGEIGG